MKASILFHVKNELDGGAIVEMVIWTVPEPVPGSTHRFKYSLYYGRGGKRIVGYDNERGKGDHRHIHGREATYRFATVEKLVADFLADVDKARTER